MKPPRSSSNCWGRPVGESSQTTDSPAGSVIPVDGIKIAAKDTQGAVDAAQRSINEMMGIDEETFKKYNK